MCVSPQGAAVYTPEAKQQGQDDRVPTGWFNNEPQDTREQGEIISYQGGVRRK